MLASHVHRVAGGRPQSRKGTASSDPFFLEQAMSSKRDVGLDGVRDRTPPNGYKTLGRALVSASRSRAREGAAAKLSSSLEGRDSMDLSQQHSNALQAPSKVGGGGGHLSSSFMRASSGGGGGGGDFEFRPEMRGGQEGKAMQRPVSSREAQRDTFMARASSPATEQRPSSSRLATEADPALMKEHPGGAGVVVRIIQSAKMLRQERPETARGGGGRSWGAMHHTTERSMSSLGKPTTLHAYLLEGMTRETTEHCMLSLGKPFIVDLDLAPHRAVPGRKRRRGEE